MRRERSWRWIHDLEIDVPYTSKSSVGGGLIGLPPARAPRIRVAKAEVTAALEVEPATATDPVRLLARIESFEPGPGLQVFALESEDKEPTPINVLKAALVRGRVSPETDRPHGRNASRQPPAQEVRDSLDLGA